MKIVETEGITFDDVLIVPKFSEVKSRHEPDVSARIGDYKFAIPIIAAPMDRVCGPRMCIALGKIGGLGALHHRDNKTIDQQVQEAEEIKANQVVVCCAVGYQDLNERAEALNPCTDIFLIDVANGHTAQMRDAVQSLKRYKKPIIAGNIATARAAVDYAEWGVDAYRVGIGPGAFCLTRTVTGCGVPQLTAIDQVRKGAPDKIIIADGGIRSSGDIAKALAVGANLVMLGNLLSGTDEAPGEVDRYIENGTERKYKTCRGMASQEANGGRKDVAAEGVSIRVPYTGSVAALVNDLVMGLKSSMTYVNARTISEFQENVLFMKISAAGRYESADRRTRGL